MSKRAISFTLALLMIFSIFSIVTVNADEIKILGTLSIKVGETKPLKFTDASGNKISVIWESSNPSIATVTSSGNVTGKKAGTCIMSTLWNGKLYGVNISVTGSSSSGSSSSGTSSSSSAFTKLKNYLIKNGTTQTSSNGETIHYIKWENKKYRYWINYNSTVKYIEYTGVVRHDSSTDYGYFKYYQYESQNKITTGFAWSKTAKAKDIGYYIKDYTKSKFSVKNKVKVKYQSGAKISNANTLANKYRKLFYPKWNKWLKSKVKVSLKSLGLMYTKSKKISLNKKSATLKKGKTLKLKLKNAKASKVKWSSSKKKVASVSKKGKVKAKAKGKAVITAKYKGKKYKCKITVKAKAKKKTSAYSKLKSYLKKKGKHKITEGNGNYYEVKWSSYRITYDTTDNSMHFFNEATVAATSKALSMGFYNGKTASVAYSEFGAKIGGCSANFKKSKLTKSCNLNFKTDDYNEFSASEIKSKAKSTLKASFPAWNKYIKSKAKVSMKQLGFTNWK